MPLPCKHPTRIVNQVEPAIDLLKNLDTLHPNILLLHNLDPLDYKNGLVFRSAIESIRGSFIASSTPGREGLVKDVLENLLQRQQIAGYAQTSGKNRFDFEIAIEQAPDYFAALEVKGGEGNSINISDRPIWAKEFGVWSHLDGAIVNQPDHGARAVVSRLTNEMIKRNKLVDVLFFKDILCGTRARPCPKYIGNEETIGLHACPDIFLFPQRTPTVNDPEPPIHTLGTLKLPGLVLDLFGVPITEWGFHVWEVHVKIIYLPDNKARRIVRVVHEGKITLESASRVWSL